MLKSKFVIVQLILLIFLSNSSIVLRSFGQEQLVNNVTTGGQTNPRMLELSNGYIVISFISSSTLYFNIFDKVGVKLTTTDVNVGGYATFGYSRMVAFSDGTFIVAYIPQASKINCQIYDKNGNTVGSAVTSQSTVTIGDSLELVKISDGSLILLWTTLVTASTNKIIKFLNISATGAALGSIMSVVDTADEKSSPRILALSNTDFIICWKDKQAGPVKEKICCEVWNPTGIQVTQYCNAELWNTDGAGYNYLSMSLMNNGSILLNYTYTNDIYQSILVRNGSSLTRPNAEVKVNSTTNRYSPDSTVLFDGSILLVFGTGSDIYYQWFNSSGATSGSNTKLFIAETYTQLYPNALALSRGAYAVAWQSNNQVTAGSGYDIWFQLYYPDDTGVTCLDNSTAFKTSDTLDLTSMFSITDDYTTTTYAKFSVLPTLGTLLYNNFPIKTGNPYNTQYINYVSPDTGLLDTITYYPVDYYGNVGASTCKITVNICYSTCDSCSKSGSESDNACSTCKSGFYQLGTMCYIDSCPDEYNGVYYYTPSSGYQCAPCNDSCAKCSSSTQCTTCRAGYYILEGATSSNCVQTCPLNYYLSKDNICKPCSIYCITCTETSTNCQTCQPNALYLAPSQCLGKCPEGYIFNNVNECISCKSQGKYQYQNTCVNTCQTGMVPNLNNLCMKCNDYTYNNQCYPSCPSRTYTDKLKMQCYLCSDIGQAYLNGECYKQCPYAYYNNVGYCTSCKDTSQFLYRDGCVVNCPPGTLADEYSVCREQNQVAIIVPQSNIF
jgi:hypothetical protein